MQTLCFLLPYFGAWPPWLHHFLLTCQYNPSINWLLYSDCGRPAALPPNVRYVGATLVDFNRLAARQLRLPVTIDNPYKLCDLKPAYGVIFADFLAGYDFWGHTDLDVVYGDIRKFITTELLAAHDIISARKEYLAGHCTIFRNTPQVNAIFRAGGHFAAIVADKNLCFFDECGGHCEALLNGRPIGEIEPSTPSMTQLLRGQNNSNVRAFWGGFAQEDLLLEEYDHNVDWEFCWNHGRLTCGRTQKEVMYLHLLSSKKNPAFVCPAAHGEQKAFRVNRKGMEWVQTA